MGHHGHDSIYLIAVCADGLVLARQVSDDALAVPEIGQPLIGYLGDDARSKARTACWALNVLVAREKTDAAG